MFEHAFRRRKRAHPTEKEAKTNIDNDRIVWYSDRSAADKAHLNKFKMKKKTN